MEEYFSDDEVEDGDGQQGDDGGIEEIVPYGLVVEAHGQTSNL
jgi:hypothetical protein